MPNRVIPYFPYALTNYTPVMRPMPVPGIQAYDECPAVCIRISEKLIPYLLGLLEIYRWKDKFEGSEEEVNTALGVIQDLMAALMEACVCCCDNPSPNRKSRYHPDTGKLQYSDDDGLTWTDAPTSDDPRFSSVIFAPPNDLQPSGDLRKCQMAHNATESFRSQVDQMLADSGAASAIASLLAVVISVVAIFLSGGAAAALLIPLVTAIVSAGPAAYAAAMTPAVYNDLKCILFCHIPDDGIITEAVWQAVKADINQQFTGIAQVGMWHHFNALGPVGLQNMCYLSAGTAADCSACVCGCEREFDFTLGLPPYSEIVQGLRVIGEGIRTVGVTGAYGWLYEYADLWIKLPERCNAGRLEFSTWNEGPAGNDLTVTTWRYDAQGNPTIQVGGSVKSLGVGDYTSYFALGANTNPALTFDAVRLELTQYVGKTRILRQVRFYTP